MSRKVYTTTELISAVLDELGELGCDINQSVRNLDETSSLSSTDRQDFINSMGSEEKDVISHVWNPILVLLEVRRRLKNRKDFTDLHLNFLKLGGRESISFQTWGNFVEEYYNNNVKEFISYIMKYFILDQHQMVALNKIITTKNETFHFVENDGKLFFISDDRPAFNVFRVNQGLSILEDLQLIKNINGSFVITSLGQVKLNEYD